MLPDGAIRSEQVWKRFRAGRIPLRLGNLFLEQTRGGRGWLWALRDVGVSLDPGDSMGIVGANGSGKSTLFKILAGVMFPEAGRVAVGGKVGALIEVSAGIHPELTGRENIFLYGSLLGLKRREVGKRFDAIVDFAELGEAIDRQVKFFSSGMRMRLGFAVAAFLEPDVLLVDEVLAVGDASFQQKCLDRMRDLLGQGTTLLFVSHDLAAVEATCQNAIWLNEGVKAAEGPVRDVLSEYRQSTEQHASEIETPSGPVEVAPITVDGAGGPPMTHQDTSLNVTIRSEITALVTLHLGISEGESTPIFTLRREAQLSAGDHHLRCTIRNLPLPRGRFFVWATVTDRWGRTLVPWKPRSTFDVAGPPLDNAPRAVLRLAPIVVQASWQEVTDT